MPLPGQGGFLIGNALTSLWMHTTNCHCHCHCHLIVDIIVNACYLTLQGRNPHPTVLHTPGRNCSFLIYLWNVTEKKNCNVSEILTLHLRAVFHPGPETDRSKIGQINNWRTLWGCCFQFWGWNLKRKKTWCCHPSAPPLSWICCLKLFRIAPWPSSTYNENSKCKRTWRGTREA